VGAEGGGRTWVHVRGNKQLGCVNLEKEGSCLRKKEGPSQKGGRIFFWGAGDSVMAGFFAARGTPE